MSDPRENTPAAVLTETTAYSEPAGNATSGRETAVVADFISTATFPAGHPRSPEAHGMIHAVQSLLYIIIVALFILTFAVQPFRIPSESMDPTLLVGDFLLVAKQNFPTSGSPLLPPTPIRRGGRPIVEPYAVYRPGPADNFRDNFPRLSNPDPDVASGWWIQMRSLVNHGELTVPPHSFFVLGDNRNDSEDSRYWGFVPASAIVGKPLLIYFSVNSAPRADADDEADTNTPDTRDSEPTPQTSAPPAMNTAKRSLLVELASFARWNRILRIVR
jgi:signal peptidase I